MTSGAVGRTATPPPCACIQASTRWRRFRKGVRSVGGRLIKQSSDGVAGAQALIQRGQALGGADIFPYPTEMGADDLVFPHGGAQQRRQLVRLSGWKIG